MNILEIRKRLAEIEKRMQEIVDKEGNASKAEDREFEQLIGEHRGIVRNLGDDPSGIKTLDDVKEYNSKSQGHITYPPVGGNNSADYSELRIFKPDEEYKSIVYEKKTEKPLNLGKYVRGICTGNWSNAGEERAMAEGTGSAGGYTVPEQLADRIINLTRTKNTATQAGAGTIELPSGNMTLAKIASHPDVKIKIENQKADETGITFEPVKMELYTLFAIVTISQELLQDGGNISQLIEKELSDSMASKLDYLAYMGKGVGEPLGIIYNDHVNKYSLGENGATLSNYNPFSYAVQKVRDNNVEPTAAIYNSMIAGSLDRLTATNDQPLLPPESFKNLRKYVTNQIPNNFEHGTADNATVSVVGKFDNLLIGLHSSGMQIKPTDVGGGALERYQYKIAVAMRADVLATIPTEFTVIEGILPEA